MRGEGRGEGKREKGGEGEGTREEKKENSAEVPLLPLLLPPVRSVFVESSVSEVVKARVARAARQESLFSRLES